MVVGFNHNFRYRGEVYHVQTEDGGLKSPHIITLLYKGGTILASKKTSYADITKVDNLDQVVEDLMKEQHREMLRRLKAGELDAVLKGQKAPAPRPAPPQDKPVVAPAVQTEPAAPIREMVPPASVERSAPPPPPPTARKDAAIPETSLDDLILSYLVGEDKKQK